jgi:hypothetical protein
MAGSSLAYNASWRLEEPALHQAVAWASGVVLWAAIAHGPLLIYPVAFFGGASLRTRLLACLFTPAAWEVKELLRVGEFFTPGETLYYGLNSVFLLAFIGTFAQAGLCEMACRWRLKRQGEPVRVITPWPVLALLSGLLALFVFFLWGMGVHWFYVYMEGYKILFMR